MITNYESLFKKMVSQFSNLMLSVWRINPVLASFRISYDWVIYAQLLINAIVIIFYRRQCCHFIYFYACLRTNVWSSLGSDAGFKVPWLVFEIQRKFLLVFAHLLNNLQFTCQSRRMLWILNTQFNRFIAWFTFFSPCFGLGYLIHYVI